MRGAGFHGRDIEADFASGSIRHLNSSPPITMCRATPLLVISADDVDTASRVRGRRAPRLLLLFYAAASFKHFA